MSNKKQSEIDKFITEMSKGQLLLVCSATLGAFIKSMSAFKESYEDIELHNVIGKLGDNCLVQIDVHKSISDLTIEFGNKSENSTIDLTDYGFTYMDLY